MLNIINNLVGLTLGQPQILTNIYWGFFHANIYMNYNIKTSGLHQLNTQHWWTTVHTNISIIEPTSDQHYILVLNTKWLIFMSTLVRWTNVGPTLYVQQGIGHDSCQHLLQWTNIAYPTPMDKLSCEHIIRWTILLMLGQRSNSDVNSRPTIQPTTNVGLTQSFYLGCRLIKIGYTILRQSYYIRVQDSTYFSANGCREHTNEPLSNFFL